MSTTLTDDELVEMITDVMHEPCEECAVAILARIRRPLEARGIGLAEKWSDRNGHPSIIREGLRTLARQHAAGEDWK
jgi:hypothetical protein